MMVIKLPRDDTGFLHLKEANTSKPVAPVTPANSTAATGSQPSPTPSNSVSAAEERRRGERRQGRQRRGRPAAVLLDTRSHYERRTRQRRCNRGQGQHSSPPGIDVRI